MRTTRRTMLVLAAATLAGAAVVAPARPAAACVMLIQEMPRRQTSDLVARALQNLEQGKLLRARGYAREVLRARRALPTQKAQAHAVLASVAWRTNRLEALAALKKARALDTRGIFVEAVLTRTADREVAEAIRHVLAG